MSHDYRNLFRLCNLAPLNINLTLKRHDVDKLYDKSPHRNNILNILKNFKYILKIKHKKGEYLFSSHAAYVPPFT